MTHMSAKLQSYLCLAADGGHTAAPRDGRLTWIYHAARPDKSNFLDRSTGNPQRRGMSLQADSI